MEIIVDVKYICERLSIKRVTYNKNPEKQLDKLRKTNHVRILEKEHSNSKQLFGLTPKNGNDLPAAFLDSNSDLKLTKNSEEQIELLLKAVLFDRIVPLHGELAKIIGKSEGTVKNRVKEMKERGILLPTPTVTIPEYDKETGEVLYEYQKKDCYWFYYDTLPNGNIKKIIDTTEVHNAYGKFFNQQASYLRNKYGKSYNSKKGSGLADNFAKTRINEDFGFYRINRVPEWTINKEYEKKICDKYRLQYA